MSDGDVFCRVAARGWRGVAAAFRDGVDPDIAAIRLSKALANELRVIRGLDSAELRHYLRVVDSSEPPTESDLAESFVSIVRTRVSDRVLPLLVGSRFQSFDEAEAYLGRCLAKAQLPAFARNLLRHPNGVGLRQPSRRRHTTADLLGVAAPLGANA
ncbi:MAG TPA: hypothetical protein VHB69_00270 [Mycobacteriales bacterium]|nr:hypothetical protein [Mycobacteriales bacterium]